MSRNDWQEIRDAIYDALSNYDCNVYYHRPSSDGMCGYFAVTINEDDYDEDDVDSCLAGVLSDYDLWIDDQSEGNEDFDICASWDE